MADEAITGRKWFSIKEAAAYLDVGEPTLYRWMRDGDITFRKVGDSTRFFQEDLDAAIKVHPSKENPVFARVFCPVCHHQELTPGEVHSTGKTYFRPNETKFWVLKDANIELQALMCNRCGYISWFGDNAKLNALRPNPTSKKNARPGQSAASRQSKN